MENLTELRAIKLTHLEDLKTIEFTTRDKKTHTGIQLNSISLTFKPGEDPVDGIYTIYHNGSIFEYMEYKISKPTIKDLTFIKEEDEENEDMENYVISFNDKEAIAVVLTPKCDYIPIKHFDGYLQSLKG